ncbi:MAG: hypothetical protein GDA45_01405 [Chromatiales bacterium]|nr:hypothetical protein [Chromatiales bacterium]
MNDELINQIISDSDERPSHAALENRLREIEQTLAHLPTTVTEKQQLLILEKAEILVELGDKQQAWQLARTGFDYFLASKQWQYAVQACEIAYRCDCEDSIAALGMACWLAITYPIEPLLSIRVLHYVIDETPDNSDGAAVVAVVAHYLVDLRVADKQRDSLLFITKQKIADVARRHRNIADEESINIWMDILGLKDPKEFLPKMAKVIEIITDDKWWFDREQLRAQLPVN